jgi:hypothetical protein
MRLLVSPLTAARQALRAGAVLAGAACATAGRVGDFPADASARAATYAPPAFEFAAPASGSTCRNPGTDPRDGTRIVLVRSQGGRGDYAVPTGRYGVARDELLRVDCASGRPVGIVPR